MYDSFSVLVTPQLSVIVLTMEDHLSLQTSTPQHTISLCWLLTTSCHIPSQPWAAPSITRASTRNANAGPHHDAQGLPAATVCGFGHLCLREPTAFTRHFFLVNVRTALIHWERHKLTNSTNGTTDSVTRTLATSERVGATATALLYSGATAATISVTFTANFSADVKISKIGATATTPAPKELFLG